VHARQGALRAALLARRGALVSGFHPLTHPWQALVQAAVLLIVIAILWQLGKDSSK